MNTQNTSENGTLIRRIELIEKSVRMWRMLSLTLFACIVLFIIIGWTAKDQILRISRIEAEEIWLHDSKGNFRSRWVANGFNNYSSMSWFGADSNNVLMTLAVSNATGDAGLLIKDRTGKSQMYLGHEDDSVAKLFFFNRDGDKLITSIVRNGAEATFTMNGGRNAKEQTILTSKGISSGAAVMKSMAIIDSAGKLAALIGTKEGKDANRFVALYDQKGIERGTFFVSKNKASGGYALFDMKGRNRVVAGTKADGSGYVASVDSLGAILWKTP